MTGEAFYNIRQETLPVQVLAVAGPYLEPKLFFLRRFHFAFQSEIQPHRDIRRSFSCILQWWARWEGTYNSSHTADSQTCTGSEPIEQQ